MQALKFLSVVTLLSGPVLAQSVRQPAAAPKETLYQAEATGLSGVKIPFRLAMEGVGTSAKSTPKAWLVNGTERLLLQARKGLKDTLVYPLVVFDADLKLLKNGANLTGIYARYDARGGTVRIPITARPTLPFRSKKLLHTRRYDVRFCAPDGSGAYQAVGQLGTVEGPTGVKAIGTFETTTGDYRFLEGAVSGDSLWLSTFDGAHLYLFTARMRGDSLVGGRFYSATGKGYEVWAGKLNPGAALPNPLGRVSAKPEVPVAITAQDTAGHTVRLTDPRFAGKPVIVQLSGTWCPNCMDETQFMAEWYRSPARKNIEVLGLFFERKPERAYWKHRLARTAERLQVPYPLAYAGPASKDSAAARLPFLTHVEAFPTTVFLDRKHRVVAVHTGFSGPATGAAFDEWKKEFERLIINILKD